MKNIASEQKSNLTEALYHTYELIKATDDSDLLFHLSHLAFNISSPFRFEYPEIDAIGIELNEWALLKSEKDNEWSQEMAKEMEVEFADWAAKVSANTPYSLEPQLKVKLKQLYQRIEKVSDEKELQELSKSALLLHAQYNESLRNLADIAQGLSEWAELKRSDDEQAQAKAKEYFEYYRGNRIFHSGLFGNSSV